MTDLRVSHAVGSMVFLGAVVLTANAASVHSLRAQVRPERTVAMTFDDLPASTLHGPGLYAAVLQTIADTLRGEGVPAIGFVNEDKLYDGDLLVPASIETLTRWLDAGLSLGNHGFRHLDLHTTPLDVYLAAIDRGGLVTSQVLEERGGRLLYFRHPFLHTGRTVAIRDSVTAHLTAHDMRVAPVTIDNQEWIFARAYERAVECRDPSLANRIGREYVSYMDSITGYYEAQSRSLLGREISQVLLLHANQLNARRLGELIRTLRDRGYDFVTLDQALRDPVYRSPDSYEGPGGITWIHRWALTQGKRGSAFAGEPDVPAVIQRAYDDPTGLPGCDGTS